MTESSSGIVSSCPKLWEQERTFHDLLYDWMQRAPWLAISVAAHVLVYFVLSAVPWLEFAEDPARTFLAEVVAPPAEVFQEPKEEPLDEVVDDEIDEPVLVDSSVAETPDSEPLELADGDPRWPTETPLAPEAFQNVLGIGPGAGGKLGNRGVGSGRKPYGRGTEKALRAALAWLANHQHANGSWDADGFQSRCGELGNTICGGPGNATHDVGVTGLALLAFLGDGHTTSEGRYQENVRRGVAWLRRQQDPDSGLFGEDTSHDFLYDHAIATLAICESYTFGRSPLLHGVAQKAVHFIQRARNPYGAWRYDVPPTGDNDTSITGWMLFALTAAKDAGLVVDPEALTGGLAWIDEVTDPVTGRVGYDAPGTLSSRTPANEGFARDEGEAMTAVGLLCRIFLGQDRGTVVGGERIVEKHVELLQTCLPVWDEEGRGCDMYYWYYGSYAMFQVGGDAWRRWEAAMREAIVKSQRQSGDERGSWDPVGPWGYSGGRMYSTALMTLCMEVTYRYGRVLGAR